MRSKKLVAAALLIALAACIIAVVPALGSRAATTTVTVRASEFKFVLSKKRAPKGTVFFKVANKGKLSLSVMIWNILVKDIT